MRNAGDANRSLSAKGAAVVALCFSAYASQPALAQPVSASPAASAAPVIITEGGTAVTLTGPASKSHPTPTGYLQGSEGAAFRSDRYPYAFVTFSAASSAVLGCEIPEAPPPPPKPPLPDEKMRTNQFNEVPKPEPPQPVTKLDYEKFTCIPRIAKGPVCPPVRVTVQRVNPSSGNLGYEIIACNDVLPQAAVGSKINVLTERYQDGRVYHPFGPQCRNNEPAPGWEKNTREVDRHKRGTFTNSQVGSCPHWCSIYATCGADGKWESVWWP